MIDYRHPRYWGQILFWSLLWFLFPLLFTHDLRLGWDYMLVHNIITAVAVSILVWINLQFLLPLYYHKRNAWFLLAGMGILLILLWLVQDPALPWNHPPEWSGRGRPFPAHLFKRMAQFRWMGSVTPLLSSFLGSSLYEISLYARQKDQESVQLQKEKLETEIKFLKSQINPHFLFNALNNIYTLSMMESKLAPDNILRLSEMLRYVLYDCNEEQVPLRKEIHYIRNYVHFYLLKDSSGLNVKLDLDESHPEKPIAPMLLIPFVENAFKHSKIEDTENGWIRVKLSFGQNGLNFFVSNSLPTDAYQKDRTRGIGIENVRRRLELIYPQQHQLDIVQGPREYCITLTLAEG